MALYRNIAGFESIGLVNQVNDTYFERYMYSEGGGGSPDDGFTPITAGVPVAYNSPVPTPAADYYPQPNVWYASENMPPTNAPEPAVIEPPPSVLYVSPTGATSQPMAETTDYMTQLPGSGDVKPTEPEVLRNPVYNVAVVDDGSKWPVVVLVATLLVAAAGDSFMKNGQTAAFIGGLGASYYLLMKPLPKRS